LFLPPRALASFSLSRVRHPVVPDDRFSCFYRSMMKDEEAPVSFQKVEEIHKN